MISTFPVVFIDKTPFEQTDKDVSPCEGRAQRAMEALSMVSLTACRLIAGNSVVIHIGAHRTVRLDRGVKGLLDHQVIPGSRANDPIVIDKRVLITDLAIKARLSCACPLVCVAGRETLAADPLRLEVSLGVEGAAAVHNRHEHAMQSPTKEDGLSFSARRAGYCGSQVDVHINTIGDDGCLGPGWDRAQSRDQSEHKPHNHKLQ